MHSRRVLRAIRFALTVALSAFFVADTTAQQTQRRFDLLITGARVYDGTGNPWFYADVGVTGDRISAVGNLRGAQATRTIDATGKYIMPGFIDLHSHADDGNSARGGFRDPDARRRAAPNLVMQGVTTVVVNQDGRSPWPIGDQKALITKNGIGPNTLLLVGHGTVRRQAMGSDTRRAATPQEITKMRELVKQGMQEGAYGLSAGLEYEPGRWSKTEEVVEIAREIVPFRGVYISHERSEGSDPMWYWPSQDPAGPPTLLDAVRETIEIGEKTGATVVASHIKAKGQNYWGSSSAAIQLIENARARGVDVWADQYSYPTSGTDGSTVLIPDWAISAPPGGRGAAAAGRGGRGGAAGDSIAAAARGGRGATAAPTRADYLRAVMADPLQDAALRRDIAHEIARRGGPERVIIFDHPDSTLRGKSIADVAALRKLSAVDAAIALQLENPQRAGGARMRGFSMSETDMENFAKQPWVATASDAGIAMPGDGAGTHARFYGTFPRKIRHYAIDRGVLSVEDAIRSMTSLPAQILGFRNRGMLREGYMADIAILDLNTYRDKATFFEPHQYAEGVVHVIVNGQFVVDNGELTWKLPGRVITPMDR
jgi:N-acyl-D-amino-acid deacylase